MLCGFTVGMLSTIIAPDSAEFCVRTEPPSASAMLFTMDSPKPAPPVSRVCASSARKNLSKICGKDSGAMPGPLSAIEISQKSGFADCTAESSMCEDFPANLTLFEMIAVHA